MAKQSNIVSNPARGLIFFEGEDLCYNYKTRQWSRIPAYDGYGMYSVNDHDKDIGLVVYSSGSVDLQDQSLSDVAQTACLATGTTDLSPGGRSVVTGIRPLYSGDGTVVVRAGTQVRVSNSITWSATVSPNSRTGYANLRREGRYHAALVEVTGGFDTIIGADIEFSEAGYV
ncbi:MAG: hypothetical protein HC808_10095 [Candidatus Competibacteraceae bacterium]|nr:hypothetical protein [Candidatus Competibacteraceae bacterium]